MPHFNYTIKKNKRFNRDTACFRQFWSNIEEIESVSIYVFPHGIKNKNGELGEFISYGYGPVGRLLEKFNTKEMLGVEKYARALAFLPGTSFVPEYKELEEKIADGPLSEFRFEQQENVYTSALIRQLWLNGIRYCWEEPYQKAARFITYYFSPNMTKLELFNLYLLAHYTIQDKANNHASRIKNPIPYTQKEYEAILNKQGTGIYGTASMELPAKIDPDTYEIIETPIEKAVRKAMKNIDNDKKPMSLDNLYLIWNNK